MRVGFDFHNVLDLHTNKIVDLMLRHHEYGDYVCVISAIGKRRIGTISERVLALNPRIDGVFEVVFKNPGDSPALKTTQAIELKLDIFYDDRKDVCDLMNRCGILCFQVPRLSKDHDLSDSDSDKAMR